MDTLFELVRSPMGPTAVLLAGAAVELMLGKRWRRPEWLTGLALFFVVAATLLWLGLRAQPVVPVYSQPWQPFGQDGANLFWVGDGWNWYVSGLILLLGGAGVLLELNDCPAAKTSPQSAALASKPNRIHNDLAVDLSVMAAALLFVGSGNLLTVVLMWVVLDSFILLRLTGRSAVRIDTVPDRAVGSNPAVGLSLLGALVLLFALLPAGPSGPGQSLQDGSLPVESIVLMLLAASIRAGVYPFHLWLLPASQHQVRLAERLLDHMAPVLCGLWLLGWTLGLGAEFALLRPGILAIVVFALLASALTAWTAPDLTSSATYVLVTSAGAVVLAGALAVNQGPEGLIWPTTAFALGGGLWLIGAQAWRRTGWQIPVSVGALALAGVPFTPGFLAQPSMARLLITGGGYALLFLLYVAAQGMLIAALLRSWEGTKQVAPASRNNLPLARLLLAAVALGLPLAVAGFLPRLAALLAGLPSPISPLLGSPPSVVADPPVWVTLILPLMLGIFLIWLRPRLWSKSADVFEFVYQAVGLNWLFDLTWWVIGRSSRLWGNGVRLVEGAGYVGWTVVVLLIVYLLR